MTVFLSPDITTKRDLNYVMTFLGLHTHTLPNFNLLRIG